MPPRQIIFRFAPTNPHPKRTSLHPQDPQNTHQKKNIKNESLVPFLESGRAGTLTAKPFRRLHRLNRSTRIFFPCFRTPRGTVVATDFSPGFWSLGPHLERPRRPSDLNFHDLFSCPGGVRRHGKKIRAERLSRWRRLKGFAW